MACFTRPEMNVERVSYPVMTPSAARGVLEAILFKPQFRWNIHRIAVKRPISFLSFRRNEVKKTLSLLKPEPIYIEEERTQRNTLALRDVEYIIEASISLTPQAIPNPANNLVKYEQMFLRRAEKGQCFNQPYLGCREFSCHFELAKLEDMQVQGRPNRDINWGLMVYDTFNLDTAYVQQPVVTASKVTVFNASLVNGIVNIPRWSEVRKQLTQPA